MSPSCHKTSSIKLLIFQHTYFCIGQVYCHCDINHMSVLKRSYDRHVYDHFMTYQMFILTPRDFLVSTCGTEEERDRHVD